MAEPASRGRVLVIAGDELLLRTYERCLRPADVVTACGARAALDVLASGAGFDVIVCPLTMPDEDVMLVHAWLSEHAPELAPRILFFHDGEPTPRMRDFIAHVDGTVIEEPVTLSELRAVVEQLMQAPRAEKHG